MNRLAVGAALLAATGPGLLFAPVFGLAALLLPVGLVALTTFGVAELCRNRLESWRAVLALGVGLLAIIETLLFFTTAGGLPTGETLRVLVAGITDSWQLTLQSTWPARPDPSLMLFVPLAVLVAAVFAVELVVRTRRPLLALLPGLAVLGLSQAYVALTGVTAVVVAFGFAALAGIVLLSADSVRRIAVLALIVPAVVAGTVLMSTVDPADRPAVSLRDEGHAPLPQERVASPLNEIADRLRHPDEPVFRYTTSDPVDRWRLIVLDTFNGAGWTPNDQYRRMGSMLKAAPSVTAPTDRRNATVRVEEDGRWLPSQAMPAEVTGVAPLVDEDAGTLVVSEPGQLSYDLSWWEPSVDPAALSGAAIDSAARRGFGDLGEIPDGITELATKAVGGTRPSFQTALVLERFLSENYRVASGPELPTGNGWPALRTFLLESKQGTSEQFATAYVVLARIVGIPARVAVGFRATKGAGTDVVVRNKDVLAWPEVAVAGIGWVPLDPSGTAASSRSSSGGGLARTTAQARAQLPPPEEVKDPELPRGNQSNASGESDDGFALPLVPLGSAVIVAIIGWLGGVPLVRTIRRWRRRRRPGARAVVGAWHEARDRVRAHGLPVKPGMTVLDLAGVVPDPPVVAGLHALAHNVDLALWSFAGCTQYTVDEAWAAVHMVHRGFARRPFLARLRAAFNARSLLPLR